VGECRINFESAGKKCPAELKRKKTEESSKQLAEVLITLQFSEKKKKKKKKKKGAPNPTHVDRIMTWTRSHPYRQREKDENVRATSKHPTRTGLGWREGGRFYKVGRRGGDGLAGEFWGGGWGGGKN